MPRRITLLIALFALLSLAAPVLAADSPAWTAWVYTGYGSLARIGADGSVIQQVEIPYTPRALDDQSPYLSFSASGRFLAYITDEALLIMDTSTGQETQIPVDNHVFNSFYVTRQPRVFDQEETMLAFGISLSDYQTHTGSWEINVYDVTTGELLHTLSDTDPASHALELPGFNFVPLIQHFEDGQVSFILYPDGIESGPHYASYTWTLDSGAVSPNSIHTYRGFDYLPSTGEIIYAMSDDRFPIYNPCAGVCEAFVHWNTLRVYDPAADTAFTFFSTPTLQIVGSTFIQNGERVLARTHDLENFSYETHVLAVIDRDGTLVSQHTVEHLTAARGVSDGFIYTTEESNTVMVVDTRNEADAAAPLWTAPTDTPVLVLWTSQPPSDITYQPWANLAPLE